MHALKMYFLLKLGIFHCHVSLPKGISFFVGGRENSWFFLGKTSAYLFLFDTWVVAIVESALNCTGSWAQLTCLSCDFHMTWVRCATRTSHIYLYFLQRTENSKPKKRKKQRTRPCFSLFCNPRLLPPKKHPVSYTGRQELPWALWLSCHIGLGDIPNGINWKCWKLKDLETLLLGRVSYSSWVCKSDLWIIPALGRFCLVCILIMGL